MAGKPTHTRADIPVLDISRLVENGSAQGLLELKRELREACASWGAYQIVGHGLPDELVSRFSQQMRAFFALPVQDKERVRRSANNARGYNDGELTKNVRDWKEVFDFGAVPHPELPDDHPDNWCEDGVNLWPAVLPTFESAMKEYFEACSKLSMVLLGALCDSLQLPPRRLHPFFEGVHTSFLRLNHYAACPEAAAPDSTTRPNRGRLGVGHHTDAGAFTLLHQDGADGLQVERDGRWVTIQPEPGALIVNLADMLQVWSNDLLRSPLHRVVPDPELERFSAPFFFNPSYDATCAPLPELVDAAHPQAFQPVRWGDFRQERAAGDYADLGEEVQLARYRTGSEANAS